MYTNEMTKKKKTGIDGPSKKIMLSVPMQTFLELKGEAEVDVRTVNSYIVKLLITHPDRAANKKKT